VSLFFDPESSCAFLRIPEAKFLFSVFSSEKTMPETPPLEKAAPA